MTQSYKREHYQKNRETKKSRDKKYYIKNTEKISEKNKEHNRRRS